MKRTVWLEETKQMRFDAPHPPAYGMQGQALGRPPLDHLNMAPTAFPRPHPAGPPGYATCAAHEGAHPAQSVGRNVPTHHSWPPQRPATALFDDFSYTPPLISW